MGTELAAGVIGMGLLGWLLDRWMHTSPWIMLGGIFVGLVGGGWNFIRRALAENKAAAERWTHDHPGGMAAIRAAKRRDKRGKGRAGAGSGGGGGADGGGREALARAARGPYDRRAPPALELPCVDGAPGSCC